MEDKVAANLRRIYLAAQRFPIGSVAIAKLEPVAQSPMDSGFGTGEPVTSLFVKLGVREDTRPLQLKCWDLACTGKVVGMGNRSFAVLFTSNEVTVRKLADLLVHRVSLYRYAGPTILGIASCSQQIFSRFVLNDCCVFVNVEGMGDVNDVVASDKPARTASFAGSKR